MIRIFVGCSANAEDAESQAVLEYSIRKNTKAEVDITWMRLSRDPASPFYSEPEKKLGWRNDSWATPFSGFRWAIPELCGFEGRGIYCDSDFIFLADIEELWNQELRPGKVVLAKGGHASWRYCCSVWDCAAVAGLGIIPPLEKLRADPRSHHNLMKWFAEHPGVVQQFEGNWNCLDGEGLKLDDPRLKALHYTKMDHQPHLRHALPRLAKAGRKHWFERLHGRPISRHPRTDVQTLFDLMLAEAHSAGYPVSKYEEDVPLFGDYR